MVWMASRAFAYAFSVALFSRVRAFSFTLSSAPSQCAPLTMTWTAGVAPYSVLVVPVGVTTNGPELRTIIDRQGITNTSLVLDYFAFPTGSEFVIVLGDATGTGTGGTSDVLKVGNGTSKACLATEQVMPKFYFYQNPTDLTQCGTVDLSWQSDKAQGAVTMMGVIPGGQTFNYKLPSDRASFQWTVDVKSGTGLMIVAGDERGRGTGGSTDVQIIKPGDSRCLDSTSPSSTSGAPAGQTSMPPPSFASQSPSSPSPSPASPSSPAPDAALPSRSTHSSTLVLLTVLGAAFLL